MTGGNVRAGLEGHILFLITWWPHRHDVFPQESKQESEGVSHWVSALWTHPITPIFPILSILYYLFDDSVLLLWWFPSFHFPSSFSPRLQLVRCWNSWIGPLCHHFWLSLSLSLTCVHLHAPETSLTLLLGLTLKFKFWYFHFKIHTALSCVSSILVLYNLSEYSNYFFKKDFLRTVLALQKSWEDSFKFPYICTQVSNY